MVLKIIKPVLAINSRSYKNFGHKRQPIPGVTLLWHGFLTFSFIGLGIEWKTIASFIFGEKHGVEDPPWQLGHKEEEEQVKS